MDSGRLSPHAAAVSSGAAAHGSADIDSASALDAAMIRQIAAIVRQEAAGPPGPLDPRAGKRRCESPALVSKR
jgi:hypothetical protein